MGHRPTSRLVVRSSARTKVGLGRRLDLRGMRRVTRRVDLVLGFGLEIAGVMALAQLSFRWPAGAVDHSSALDGRALADFFRPARQVFIFVRLQELAWVVVRGAV